MNLTNKNETLNFSKLNLSTSTFKEKTNANDYNLKDYLELQVSKFKQFKSNCLNSEIFKSIDSKLNSCSSEKSFNQLCKTESNDVKKDFMKFDYNRNFSSSNHSYQLENRLEKSIMGVDNINFTIGNNFKENSNKKEITDDDEKIFNENKTQSRLIEDEDTKYLINYDELLNSQNNLNIIPRIYKPFLNDIEDSILIETSKNERIVNLKFVIDEKDEIEVETIKNYFNINK